MKELTQKSSATSKKISIETDCLLVQTKSVKEELEYKIKFEQLGFDIIKKRIKTANIPFYFMLLLVLLCLGLLIESVASHEVLRKQVFWIVGLIFFSVITISTYYQRNKDVIYLTGGRKTLELLATKPDIESVKSFIEEIHQSMRQYYKDKYLKFEPQVPLEMRIHQLNWLKEIKALTEEEYNEALYKSKTDSVIGFQRRDLEE